MSTSDPRRQGSAPSFVALDETAVPYPPDHPLGHRAMVNARALGPAEPEFGHRSAADPQPFLVKPPPDDMNIDPGKWAALTRPERRGLLAEHRRVKRAQRSR